MPKLASINTCTGCMACGDICPKNAISAVNGYDGHRYVETDTSLCVECNLCEKTCPVVNGDVYGENSLKSNTE